MARCKVTPGALIRNGCAIANTVRRSDPGQTPGGQQVTESSHAALAVMREDLAVSMVQSRRLHHQVVVVPHHTVGVHHPAEALHDPGEQLQKRPSVLVVAEDELARVPARDRVNDNTRETHTQRTRHHPSVEPIDADQPTQNSAVTQPAHIRECKT